MASEDKVWYTAKEIFSYIWYRYNRDQNLPEMDSVAEEKVGSFIFRLRDVIWVDMFHAWAEWQKFMTRHHTRMTSSPKLYITYVTFACYLTNDEYSNGFKYFTHILALVAGFAVFAKNQSHKEFVHVSLKVFTAFFDKEIRMKFNKEGGWKKFLKSFPNKESAKNMKSLDDLFKSGSTLPEIVEFLDIKFPGTHKVGKLVLKDIRQNTVETNERTLSLVETISDAVEEICRQVIAEQEAEKLPVAVPETAQASTPHSDKLALINDAKEKLKDAVNDISILTGVLEVIYPQLAVKPS